MIGRRVLAALLARIAGGQAEGVVGDLEEEYAARRRAGATGAGAWLWYLREWASVATGLLVERSAEVFAGAWLAGSVRVARQSLRAVLRRPGGPAVVALTLAVAVGGVTTVASLVHAAWIRDLPWRDDEALVRVFGGYRGADGSVGTSAVAPEVLRSVIEPSRALDGAAAWTIGETVHTVRGGEAVRLVAPRATASLFPLLGVEPALGRLFVSEDEVPGGDRAVLLSHAFWVTAFGADSAAVGAVVELDGVPHRVEGVLPPRAAPAEADLWRPLALGPEWYTEDRIGWEMLAVVARTAAGTAIEEAEEALRDDLAGRTPDRVDRLGQTLVVRGLRDVGLGGTGPALLGLLAAAGLVLVVAGVNVAVLLAVRFEDRLGELTLRRSLGAGAPALAQLVLFEAALVAAGGGILGLGLAKATLGALTRARLDLLAPLLPLEVSPAVLLVVLATVMGTGLLVGAAPAFRAFRLDADAVLRDAGGRAVGGRRSGRTRRALVAAEIGMALTLLAGLGVSLRALGSLAATDPGFRPEGLLTLDLEAPPGLGPAERADLWERVRERARAIPGVDAVGLTYTVPLTGTVWSASFDIVAPDADQASLEPGGNMRPVSPGYFRAAGIPLLDGRDLTPADDGDAAPVAVVDAALAERFWPGRSPVGRRIVLGAIGAEPATVVGVVGTVRDQGLHAPGSGHVYFPVSQSPQRSMTLVARAEGEPPGLVPALREAVREVDDRVPLVSVAPAAARVRSSLAGPRLGAIVLGGFGVVAALLAGLGVFGVVAWTVRRRTPEIGTRVALGADRRAVVGLVLGEVAGLWLGGCALGVAGGLAAAGVVDRVVPGGAPLDASVLVATSVVMGLLAATAAAIPAVRAVRIDAVDAMRDG